MLLSINVDLVILSIHLNYKQLLWRINGTEMYLKWEQEVTWFVLVIILFSIFWFCKTVQSSYKKHNLSLESLKKLTSMSWIVNLFFFLAKIPMPYTSDPSWSPCPQSEVNLDENIMNFNDVTIWNMCYHIFGSDRSPRRGDVLK